jgi:hypothetical protein
MTDRVGAAPTPPDARGLLRATLLAVIAAAAITVGVVLPAEYGVDPTGIGRVLGLTQMGQIKVRLAAEAAADAAADSAAKAEEAGSNASSPREETR